MSPSADASRASALLQELGITSGQIVQELGYDDDVDMEFRDAVEDQLDEEFEDEDAQTIVDAVLMWWREGDGDLTDALVDAIATLEPGGPIWVLAPKPGRDGHVLPADVQEAANTAGLRVMGSHSLAKDWTGTRLASRNG